MKWSIYKSQISSTKTKAHPYAVMLLKQIDEYRFSEKIRFGSDKIQWQVEKAVLRQFKKIETLEMDNDKLGYTFDFVRVNTCSLKISF